MRDFARELAALDDAGLRRHRRVVTGALRPILDVDGRRVVDFASNDYLGLADHPRITAAAVAAARQHGVGGAASHLISGHHQEHAALETELAAFVGLPRALYFSSGYQANSGIVPALVGRGDAVFSDALNHACLIDGARLSRADVHVFPHADAAALASQLARSTARHKLVLSDAVFSMDGDIAPVAALVELCDRHDAMLLLDDAHGFGVLGRRGRGALEHFDIRSPRVLYLGTLGKAAGVSGAFVAGPADAIEWLVQRARTYIFTTATPPMLAAAVREGLAVMRDEPWRLERVRRHVRRLRDALRSTPWSMPPSDTAIQPLIVGGNGEALALMQSLWERGLWVPAIRPPTVPAGTARLRISLSAAHDDAHIDALTDALRQSARTERAETSARSPTLVVDA